MESSSAISTTIISNEDGNSGNQEVKDDPLNSSKCPTHHENLASNAPISIVYHGGETMKNWGRGPILFPFPNGDDSENSDDSQSLSVPPPPLYVPRDHGTPSEVEERRKIVQHDFDSPLGGTVVQNRGIDGKYRAEFYEFAREALKLYNKSEGRNFKLADLMEVELYCATGVICLLEIEAVDADAPTDPPVMFEGEYWWHRIDEEDGVISCNPKQV